MIGFEKKLVLMVSFPATSPRHRWQCQRARGGGGLNLIWLTQTTVNQEPFVISFFQGMYDDAEEDAGANGDGGGEESMDAD